MNRTSGNRQSPSDLPAGSGVQVYWRPGCPYCARLRRVLRRRGVQASWRNVWADAAAARLVLDVAGGNETVPTVSVAGRMLVNPPPRQLLEVIARDAPQALGPSPDGPRERLRSWLGRSAPAE